MQLMNEPSQKPSGPARPRHAAIRHTLPNGIVARIQYNPSVPTISIRGEVRVGSANEPPHKAGLSAFTASALIRGTHNRTFQHIVSATEERGCSVNAGGGVHSSVFSGKMLTEEFPLVLDILADMLIRPSFPESEIERLRNQYLMALRESEQDTHTQASRAVRAMLYPPEHPYSRLASGTVDTVKALSRDDMVAFHQHYHPAHTTMAIVGDIHPEAAIAALEHTFGAWHPSTEPTNQTLPPICPLQHVQRRDIPMVGKVQSDIVWCVHGLSRQDDDFYAAMVGDVMLGHLGLGGRLGENVRERQGLAYYTYTDLQAGLGAGPWAAGAGVNPTNVELTIQSILHEIERFKQDGPTENELADAKAFLTGSLALGMETNAGIANLLLYIEAFGLGEDYIERYPVHINHISREAIIEVARTYLSTEHYVVAVAGPGA